MIIGLRKLLKRKTKIAKIPIAARTPAEASDSIDSFVLSAAPPNVIDTAGYLFFKLL